MRSVRDTTYTLLRRAGPRSRSRTGGGVPMLGTAYTARAPGPRPLLWHNICIFAPACACAQQMCRARARAPVAWIDARSAGVQLYRVCTRHEANFAMGSCALGGTGNANVERSAEGQGLYGHTYSCTAVACTCTATRNPRRDYLQLYDYTYGFTGLPIKVNEIKRKQRKANTGYGAAIGLYSSLSSYFSAVMLRARAQPPCVGRSPGCRVGSWLLLRGVRPVVLLRGVRPVELRPPRS